MSPVDDRTLQRLSREGGRPIDDDRPCRKCGYNLKGLVTGGVCPECGTPIRSVARRPTRALGGSPRRYLDLLKIGSGLLAFGGLGFSALALLVFLTPIGNEIWQFLAHAKAPMRTLAPNVRVSLNAEVFKWIFAGLGLVWVGGTWPVTRPRPDGTVVDEAYDPSREWRLLRWGARGASVLAVASAWAMGAWIAHGSGSALVVWFVGATLAVVPVAVYLSRLLFWACEENLAWACYGAVTMMGVVTAVLALALLPAGVFLRYVGLVISPMFFLGVGALQWASVRMVVSIGWAVRHAEGAEAIEQRRRERAEAEAAKAEAERQRESAFTADRVAMLDRLERRNREMEAEEAAAHAEGSTSEAEAGDDDTPQPGRTNQRVIPRTGEGETYGLEGE